MFGIKKIKNIINKRKEINRSKKENKENKENETILIKKIDDLNKILLKSNVMEITNLIGNKKELFIRNFISGISRGIGIGIGVTFITAILIWILQKIVTLNIPIIGEYITDIVDIVMKSKY